MVTVDPRTQALIWAAEKAAREVTVTLNLLPPPGMVALKSGRLAAGISSPARYIPKRNHSNIARRRLAKFANVL